MKRWKISGWLMVMVLALAAGWVMAACDDDDDDGDDDEIGDDDAASPADDDASGDDDDQETPADDDDDDNNDDDEDDDDDDNDDNDDDNGHTCLEIGPAVADDCGWMMRDVEGSPVGAEGLSLWCIMTENTWVNKKSRSPFWNCMGEAAIGMSCDNDYADNVCKDPPDPGAGCAHTTHTLYHCGIRYLLNSSLPYYLPLMDWMDLCSRQTDIPWDCWAECAVAHPCSDPPTIPEFNELYICLIYC